MLKSYKWDGWDWKSRYALIQRALRCGAHKKSYLDTCLLRKAFAYRYFQI